MLTISIVTVLLTDFSWLSAFCILTVLLSCHLPSGRNVQGFLGVAELSDGQNSMMDGARQLIIQMKKRRGRVWMVMDNSQWKGSCND
jgi:hypothetical protein